MQTRYGTAALLLAVTILIVASLLPAAAQAIVYKNDFALGPNVGFAPGVYGAWSPAPTSVTPSRRYGQFLGEFGGQTVSLALTNLSPHREVTVSFHLFILKSWDGNQVIDPASGLTIGPDVWSLYVSGGATLLTTTFSNSPQFTQAFPGSYPGASFGAGTGSAEINTLGYQFAGPRDAVYPMSFRFPHTGNTLTLNFVGSSNLQGIADESWGLDDVEVLLDANPPPETSPPELDLHVFLVRIEGAVYVVGTVANRGTSEANVTLRSATLALFNPLEFHEALETMPLSLGSLAPGEQRDFGARFPGSIGPPGREAALTLSGILQWRGSPDAHPNQVFSRDFNNLRLP
jgi:hypothetical protein